MNPKPRIRITYVVVVGDKFYRHVPKKQISPESFVADIKEAKHYTSKKAANLMAEMFTLLFESEKFVSVQTILNQ